MVVFMLPISMTAFYRKSSQQWLGALAIGQSEPVFGRFGLEVGEVAFLFRQRQLIPNPLGRQERLRFDTFLAEVDDSTVGGRKSLVKETATDLPGLFHAASLVDVMATETVANAVGLSVAHEWLATTLWRP